MEHTPIQYQANFSYIKSKFAAFKLPSSVSSIPDKVSNVVSVKFAAVIVVAADPTLPATRNESVPFEYRNSISSFAVVAAVSVIAGTHLLPTRHPPKQR